ncbi:MAG: DNA-processing protein DprA [Tepidisphaerales bacterium]
MTQPTDPLSEDDRVLDARRSAWLTLSLTAGLGPVTMRRVADAGLGVLGAMRFSHAQWAEVEGIGTVRATQVVRDLPRAAREAQEVLQRCDAGRITVLTPDDDAYPALCRDLPDAPCVIYVRGTLEPRDLCSVAIVGSRQCSHYGRDQAARLASLLAGAGYTVVSGGARGVDSAAHEGALRCPGGRTLVVLGCGVDVVYPPENDALFRRVIELGQGALVSHYPPGTPPHARHFPERNRLISALSRGVLVVEADLRSGSLITARIAADDHNRPVMALPGRVDNPLSAGPHDLLRQGAALVTGLEDILDALGPAPDSAFRPRRHRPAMTRTADPSATPAAAAAPDDLFEPPARADGPPPPPPPASALPAESAEAAAILAALREHREAPPDVLIDATGLPAAVVLQQLTLLALKGRVKRLDAQTYALART